MKNLFICYPKCSSCRKAEKWLEEEGIDFEKRDIREDRPKLEELSKWIGESGLALKRFFNTSGVKYRELGLKDRLEAMSDREKIEVLASDGMLLKRPIFISGKTILVGFKEGEWKEKLIP